MRKFTVKVEILGDGRIGYVIPNVGSELRDKKEIAWALRRVIEQLDPGSRTEKTEQ